MVDQLKVTDGTIPGGAHDVPVRDYQPSRANDDLTPFIWVHGGGFVAGNLKGAEADQVAREIAERSGRRVRTVDYRKAPFLPALGIGPARPSKNQFPAAVDDIDLAIDESIARFGRIIVGGASAGATIVASALIRRRELGKPMPTAAVLLYGVFHAELPPISDELDARVRGYRFTPVRTRRMNANYAGGTKALQNPNVFPGGQDLHGFPPTLVLHADRDALRASGELFVTELESAGVPVTGQTINEATHGFLAGRKLHGFEEGVAAMITWMGRTPHAGADFDVATAES